MAREDDHPRLPNTPTLPAAPGPEIESRNGFTIAIV
jgi:hypothetical protein